MPYERAGPASRESTEISGTFSRPLLALLADATARQPKHHFWDEVTSGYLGTSPAISTRYQCTALHLISTAAAISCWANYIARRYHKTRRSTFSRVNDGTTVPCRSGRSVRACVVSIMHLWTCRVGVKCVTIAEFRARVLNRGMLYDNTSH